MNKCGLFSAQAHPCLRAARLLLSCPLTPPPAPPSQSTHQPPPPPNLPLFRYLIALIQSSSLLSFGPSIQAHVWELTATVPLLLPTSPELDAGWLNSSITVNFDLRIGCLSTAPFSRSSVVQRLTNKLSVCVSEGGQIETTKTRHDLNKLVRFRQVSIKVSKPFEDLMASGSILRENYTVPGLVTFYVKYQVKQTA